MSTNGDPCMCFAVLKGLGGGLHLIGCSKPVVIPLPRMWLLTSAIIRPNPRRVVAVVERNRLEHLAKVAPMRHRMRVSAEPLTATWLTQLTCIPVRSIHAGGRLVRTSAPSTGTSLLTSDEVGNPESAPRSPSCDERDASFIQGDAMKLVLGLLFGFIFVFLVVMTVRTSLPVGLWSTPGPWRTCMTPAWASRLSSAGWRGANVCSA
jgi:hypothetical protein